jgi:hypothetical protein
MDFESVVLGVDLGIFYEKPKKEFVWKDEILKLIGPLIRSLEHMTARPRQIEELRNEIAQYENQLAIVKEALKNLETFSSKVEVSEGKLKVQLDNLKESWEAKEKQISDQLTVSRVQLEKLLEERRSVFESGRDFIKSFFRSRGRNLFLSLLAFISVFVGLRYCYRLIYRFSPFHKPGERTIYVRLADVLYHTFTVVGAIGAVLFVFYVSGDWMLLSLAIIFLFGIAWTAKEGLPLYWKQIQLMLNLGTVRENERIVYFGVPWRVVSLNLFTTLENPALTAGVLRIPLKEMIGVNSRPYEEGEPWFPSNIGEWVILSDETRGEIITQTPEMVQLALRGGSKKTYQTQDFLSLSPLNISADFRLKIVFGFDYEHQAIITDKIPQNLTEALKQGLNEKGHGDDLIQLKVEVEAAGNSSLDLVIIADFSGKIAALYNVLKRTIQKLTIDACTKNGWGIPFPQLTIHTPDTRYMEPMQKTRESI